MILYEVPGLVGYRISAHAEVMSMLCEPPQLVAPQVDPDNGCYMVMGHPLQELMARTFLGPCPPGMIIGFKDGNKLNPALSNLLYEPTKVDRCVNGHELSEDNIYWRPGRGNKLYRKCKRCQIDATLRCRANKKARASAPSSRGAPGS